MAAVTEAPVAVQGEGVALAQEACQCGACFVPEAAFCLHCGARRGVLAAPTLPAPWFQQAGCMPPGGQTQFPWPGHMVPYSGPPQWHPGGDWSAYMPADQNMVMQPCSPRMQPCSPRMQPCSPRLQQHWPEQFPTSDTGHGVAGYVMQPCSPRMQPCSPRLQQHWPEQFQASDTGHGVTALFASAPVLLGSNNTGVRQEDADPKKESRLPCRPCKRPRCSKPRCNYCKGLLAGIPSCKTVSRRLRRAVQSVFRPCTDAPVIQSGRWRLWVVAAMGLAATGSLLAALLDDPPHLLAAGLAAMLGWLACYAYMLQRECWRLARSLELDIPRQLGGNGDKEERAPPFETDAQPGGVDLDVTGLARSLGSPFCNGLGAVAPGSGKSGQTMQAVLTSALVNEYLRCASLLKKYQTRHGLLPNSSQCNPGFAEALLMGLHGPMASAPGSDSTAIHVPAALTPRSSALAQASEGYPAAAAVAGGTPNFADRLAAANSEPVRNNPSAESQKATAVASFASSSSQQETVSPGASSVPPPPSAGELDRCHTIDNASGDPFSSAPMSEMEASPEVVRGPASRTSARAEDLESSCDDPPWLRQIRKS